MTSSSAAAWSILHQNMVQFIARSHTTMQCTWFSLHGPSTPIHLTHPHLSLPLLLPPFSIRNLSVCFQLTSFFIDQRSSNSCAIFNISVSILIICLHKIWLKWRLEVSCTSFTHAYQIEFDNAAVSGAIPVEVTVEPTFANYCCQKKSQC